MQNKHYKNLDTTQLRAQADNPREVINQTITQTIVQSVSNPSSPCITQSITQSFVHEDKHLLTQTIAQTVCATTPPEVSQTITQSFDEATQKTIEQTLVQQAGDAEAGDAPQETTQTLTQTIPLVLNQSIKQSILFATVLAAQTSCLGLAQAQDLADCSLAQLLDTKVSSAARYEQATRDAPASVQVISAQQIAQHGWTTLAQALSSLPGLYGNTDRLYDYQGARGVQVAGDYNTRLLLLIDGQRNNDNVYGQALLGAEGWLDMSTVERIEYIAGPGSALYGANAMFGTVNVITKRASATPQREVSALVSSGGLTGVNVLGVHQHGETGLLLQYSQQQQAGRDARYQNPQNLLVRGNGVVAADGIAYGLDFATNRRALLRLDYQDWAIKLIAHERALTPSSAPFMTVFDDPSLRITDGGQQLSISHQQELSARSSVYAAMSYTDFHYRTRLPYVDARVGYYQAYIDTQGQSLQAESNVQVQAGLHHLLTGIELGQDLLARQQQSFSVNPALLGTRDVNINPLSRRSAVFMQDEWQLHPAVALHLGLRGDAATKAATVWSPRLGAVWQITPDWTTKLLAGRAYRSPSAYEKLFGDGINVLPNPNLRPETLDTRELVVAWRSSAVQQWQMSLFDNQWQNSIAQVDVNGLGQLQFQNVGSAQQQGAELSWQMQREDAAHWTASWAHNRLAYVGKAVMTSPRDIVKAGYAYQLGDSVELAHELQFISARHYQWRGTPQSVASGWLFNATLSVPNWLWQGLRAQLRVEDLLNRAQNQPVSAEMLTPNVPSYGRTFSGKLDYAF
ncbi:MAG: TonB-dependent receptor plug domain-containing protein [Gallionella sp.]